MPHIKVAPFETTELDRLIGDETPWEFRAVQYEADPEKSPVELLGVVEGGERFILEIHRRKGAYLIKPDKVSRPLDVNRIKRALRNLSDSAGLRIVQENIAIAPTKTPLAEAYAKRIEDFESPDFGGRPLVIEVGFGSGRHLLYQAKAHPDALHIGIEIHTPSAQQVLKQIERQGLTNVWVVNYDARLLLEMLPSNVARAVYVHFPVPWDKKPHRRVISVPFVEEAMRVLAPEGVLELRTDSDNYYQYALEVFSRGERVRFEVRKNHEVPVRSKYEERWQRQNKDIYTLRRMAEAESPEPVRTYRFDFDRLLKPMDALLALPVHALIRPDHFVHFERRYRMVTEEGALIKCSFGSFDRPEHKWIAVRSGQAAYYPHPPVRSATNARAHHTIGVSVYV